MSATFSLATKLFRSCSSTTRARLSTYHSGPVLSSAWSPSRHYSAAADASSKTTSGEENAPPPAEKAGEADTDGKLKAKDEEIADLTSRLRYAQADFVNLQKISAREKEQTSLYAITNFARDLITTVDVLSLALKSVPQSAVNASSSDPSGGQPHLKQLYEGVEMTQRQLLQTLSKYGVTPFDPTGEKFDPNMHEALYEAPVPGKESGSVIECSKLGYKIKDRTLRAAQVGVARGA
ncbi:Mitochondrial matrix cochaperone [Tulasnella sp. 403]|nr:Mitochondrial matrix cochaperone [Tulasnella sp. 403]